MIAAHGGDEGSRLELDSQLRRYLIGELSPGEMEPLEERLMTDDELQSRLALLEDELIDDYASRTLSPAEHKRMEASFFSSEQRREKLRFARAAQRFAQAKPEQRLMPVKSMPIWHLASQPSYRPVTLAFAALLVVAFALSGWWWFTLHRVNEELASTSQALIHERGRTAQLTKQAGGEVKQTLLAVHLLPGLSRGGGALTRVAPAQPTEVIELRLWLGSADYGKYSASLQTVEGTQIATNDPLVVSVTSEGRWAIFRIPAQLLPPGDYRMRLSATKLQQKPEELQSYYFRVTP